MTLFDPLSVERRWLDVRNSLPKFGSAKMRPLDKISWLVIHHTASNSMTTPAQLARDAFEKFQADGISYHFLIYSNGDLYLTRNPAERPACVALHNSHCLCVALVGNYSVDLPTEPMIETLADFCAWALVRYPSISNILPHKFFKATECPGDNIPWRNFRVMIQARMLEIERPFYQVWGG